MGNDSHHEDHDLGKGSEASDCTELPAEGEIWESVAAQWQIIEFIFSLKYEQKYQISEPSDGNPLIRYRSSSEELENIEFALSNGQKMISLFNEKSAADEYNLLAWHYFSEASFHAGVCPSSDRFGQFRSLWKGVSGSSGLEIMRLAADAASVDLRVSGA